MKITQDELVYTVTNGHEEMLFIKGEPEEIQKLLQHILYTLGIGVESVKVVFKKNVE